MASPYGATNARYRELVQRIRQRVEEALRDRGDGPCYVGDPDVMEAELRENELSDYREALEEIRRLVADDIERSLKSESEPIR